MLRSRRAVTTRAGGRSAPPYDSFNLAGHVGDDPAAVSANRARLADLLGGPRLVFLDQVHGAGVVVVEDAPVGDSATADAAVTRSPDLALVVLVADCVPVLLADPVAGVVGAVHAGRSGAAAGVLPAALAAMVGLGAEVARIDALLGPAVCAGCYEVPAALRDEVAAALPGSAATSRRGTPALDLQAGLARQLAEAGVSTVAVDRTCTAEDRRYFSYRRDGRTGRFAGVAWLSADRR